MALPEFSMRQLLEAGAHFGHQTHRWNPKMERYIFGSRSNIHIIDLSQTMPLLHQALVKVREVAASGGRVLFVGTKRQASEPVATAAKRCAQYYVNHRWLGGTLTNWRTISGVDRAAARAGSACSKAGRFGPHQEGAAEADPRARQAGAVPGRHQGHGRHPRPDVRDRHQQGSDRDPGSAQAEHPGGGDPRHQLRPARHQLPDPGQRRCGPRAAALLRPGRRRGARRPDRRPGGHGRRHRRRGGPGRTGAAKSRPPPRRRRG